MARVDEAEIRRFWNARAREDPFYFVDTRQPYKAPDPDRFWDSEPLLDYILDELGVRVSAGDTVLEIGCGIGRITRALAGRTKEVIALDISDEMLRQARELNPQLANVRWMLGDGASLAGVADHSVDACVSTVVFQHLPKSELAFRYVQEIGRVLRPRGWAALQVSNDPQVHRYRDTLWMRAKALIGRAPAGRRHPAWLGSPIELPDLEAAAGQSDLDLERVWGQGTQYCQVLLRRR